jgi:hypothetical protein
MIVIGGVITDCMNSESRMEGVRQRLEDFRVLEFVISEQYPYSAVSCHANFIGAVGLIILGAIIELPL